MQDFHQHFPGGTTPAAGGATLTRTLLRPVLSDPSPIFSTLGRHCVT